MADAEKLMLIKRTMIDLEYVWNQNADLRLGQLMENLFGCGMCMYGRPDQLIADTLAKARAEGLAVVLNDQSVSDAGDYLIYQENGVRNLDAPE